jgi:glycosyltransferase involved in cell wall biosynthesis
VTPLVVLDADSLGRRRTGDETYVAGLLGALPPLADDLRIAAVTRSPELVPEGVDAIEVPARSQELRMAWSLPRLLRRLRPALAHFVHAIPPRCPCPAVLTIQDLSFERDASVMGWRDRRIFKLVVPWSVRRAARVLAISERTKADLVELYGLAPEKIVVTPLGVGGEFRPSAERRPSAQRTGGGGLGEPGGSPGSNGYALFVGAIEPRKNPLAAAEAARQAGLRLVVAGPTRDERLAGELARAGAELRGYVEQPELAELYRGAACLVHPSRYEGFGLTVVEAMASGTPVVATPDAAVREVAGDAAVFAGPGELADGIRRAVAERERLSAAGLERARQFTWEETARRTVAVYRELLAPR